MDSPAAKRRLGRPFTSWSHNFPRNRPDNARHRSWSVKVIPAGSAAAGKLSTVEGVRILLPWKRRIPAADSRYCLFHCLEGEKPQRVRCRISVRRKVSQVLSSELTRRRLSVKLPRVLCSL